MSIILKMSKKNLFCHFLHRHRPQSSLWDFRFDSHHRDNVHMLQDSIVHFFTWTIRWARTVWRKFALATYKLEKISWCSGLFCICRMIQLITHFLRRKRFNFDLILCYCYFHIFGISHHNRLFFRNSITKNQWKL